MILCDCCKGTGTIPTTPFGRGLECSRCTGSGRLSFRDLRHGDHVCLLFKEPHAQISDALDFLIEGLRYGERLLYAWDEHPAEDIRIRLIEKGADVTSLTERGALEIVRAKDVYVYGGEFEPKRVLNFYQGYVDATLRAGFKGLRVAAEGTWVLRNPDWIARLGEYETLVDEYMRSKKPPVIALCQYNRTRFTPEMIAMALGTHGAAVLS